MSRPRPRRPALVLTLLLVLWVGVLALAPLIGSHAALARELLAGDPTALAIFWQLRLPRVLLALLAGGGLAVSGLGFQTLFRNPLAEPYTLGVASGAALGAVLALRLAEGRQLLGFPLLTLFAFAGALAATGLVVGLGGRRQGDETGTLLLAGIAVSLSSSALILFVQYLSDSTQTFRMVRWMMGGLSVAGYREVLWLLPWVIGGSAALLALRWD
ncbi:MAG: cobalamin transport system permease protein, partial [Acidobacteriota bacterium]|nr:cobalamin transport system permease protein [Acidobacteriota bacterium]